MMKGKIKFFQPLKGYGFIQGNDEDYFFHLSQCPNNYSPKIGDIVEFTPVKNDKGFAAQGIIPIDLSN